MREEDDISVSPTPGAGHAQAEGPTVHVIRPPPCWQSPQLTDGERTHALGTHVAEGHRDARGARAHWQNQTEKKDRAEVGAVAGFKGGNRWVCGSRRARIMSYRIGVTFALLSWAPPPPVLFRPQTRTWDKSFLGMWAS
jgi:hypothetical protein